MSDLKVSHIKYVIIKVSRTKGIYIYSKPQVYTSERKASLNICIIT